MSGSGIVINGGAGVAVPSSQWPGAIWTPVPYLAGNFTANGAMTWTVEEADVFEFSYIVIGKMMTVGWDLRTTTVGGTPANVLNIAVPGGYNPAGSGTWIGTGWNDQNGAQSVGVVSLDGSETNIFNFVSGAVATNWTATTNTTRLIGQITFAID